MMFIHLCVYQIWILFIYNIYNSLHKCRIIISSLKICQENYFHFIPGIFQVNFICDNKIKPEIGWKTVKNQLKPTSFKMHELTRNIP